MDQEKHLKKRVLIIGSTYNSLTNFRGHLINDLTLNNYKVITSSGDTNINYINLNEKKIEHKYFFLNRHSLNIFKELFTILSLIYTIFKSEPDIIISYTIKPNLYIGLILKLFKHKKIKFFPIVTGLGHLFYSNKTFIILTRHIVKKFLFYSFTSSNYIFFQNKDNQKFFIDNKLCNLKKSILIPGSGIDLKFFLPQKFPNFPLVFLMSSRLLNEKGVIEYFKCANIIKKKYSHIRFIFQYSLDKFSKDSIDLANLDSLNSNKHIEIYQSVKDIRDIMSKCHVFVLPSYHEGLPRTSIEALALGKPIITTDVPGCRETVLNNLNGYLVKEKNLFSLLKAMVKLIKNDKYLLKMSKESRNLAIRKFDYKIVNQIILSKLN